MKLRHLRIHNYRSIRELELAVPDMVVFLGPNNHGKSNILSALEFGLLPSAKPVRGDFFAFRPEGDSTLCVEMTFGDLTDQEQTTFQKYLRNDGSVRVRKSARLEEGEGVEISYNGYVQEPQQWWLKSSAAERLSSRDLIEEEAKNVPEASAEMQRWSALLEEEISGWPQVSSRPMFGMLAFYRGKKIFAALPRTRAAETDSSLLIKLPGVEHPRLKRGSGPGAGWATFEMSSEADLAEALRWLEVAYQRAR